MISQIALGKNFKPVLINTYILFLKNVKKTTVHSWFYATLFTQQHQFDIFRAVRVDEREAAW